MRRDYSLTSLSLNELLPHPMDQFKAWFEEAIDCPAIADPNAMVLSTADTKLHVTSRTVLLKGYSHDGFQFFTNSTSAKGQQIKDNPQVALLFYWAPLERQILITGKAALLPKNITENYFHSRPRESQLAAWASYQSQPLAHRKELEERMQELQKRFKNKPVPLPDFWNGYLVSPENIDFWQGRSNRLHDRFRYTKQEDREWKIDRLNP